MCTDRSTGEAGITFKSHRQQNFTFFPHLFILLTKYRSTHPLRSPKHLRYHHVAGRGDTGPWQTSIFLKGHLAATQVLLSAQTAARPHYLVSCINLCTKAGRNTLLQKMMPTYQQQFSVSLLILKCAVKVPGRGFAFIGSSWLALSLSKSPVVVNGE